MVRLDIPIQRSRSLFARYRRWFVGVALVGGMFAAATVALGRLSLEPPGVARAGLWIGDVERGEMLLAVQGNGRLVSQSIQWITAKATLADLRATLRNDRLPQKSTVATLKIDHASAQRGPTCT